MIHRSLFRPLFMVVTLVAAEITLAHATIGTRPDECCQSGACPVDVFRASVDDLNETEAIPCMGDQDQRPPPGLVIGIADKPISWEEASELIQESSQESLGKLQRSAQGVKQYVQFRRKVCTPGVPSRFSWQ